MLGASKLVNGQRRQISVYSLAVDSSAIPAYRQPPRGATAVGVFFLLGAVTASLAGTSLLWRGSALDRMWALNPHAYRELTPLGKAAGTLFLLLAVALVVACVGWFKRRRWGWQLGVIIIATQVLGDLVNVFLGHIVQGGMGLTIAGMLLFYLTRRNVRAGFGPAH